MWALRTQRTLRSPSVISRLPPVWKIVVVIGRNSSRSLTGLALSKSVTILTVMVRAGAAGFFASLGASAEKRAEDKAQSIVANTANAIDFRIVPLQVMTFVQQSSVCVS